MRLLGLEFKSGNMITSKAIKNIVKKYYSIRSNCLILLHIKTMEYIMSIVKKILGTKILVSGEINKIEKYFYQVVLFVAKKNIDSLKVKKLVTSNSLKLYSTINLF